MCGSYCEKMPVEAGVPVPLPPLPYFSPHEDELLAGLGVHIGKEEPEVGKFLPEVAGHLIEKRALPVDYLVMREHENKVLGEGVQKRKGKVVLMVFAKDGVVGEIPQDIVHPSHVPFHAEAEPAEIRGTGDRGPGGRFFGDGEHAGMAAVDDLVEPFYESDCLKVFVAAVLVGDPLAALLSSSRGRAWRRPRRPAGRRCGTCRARRGRWK